MIQEYIEFAIDNGYQGDDRLSGITGLNWNGDFIVNGYEFYGRGNDIELITSKEFIEAIARGLEKKMKWDKIVKQINKLQSDKNLKKILNKNTGEQLKVIKKYFG